MASRVISQIAKSSLTRRLILESKRQEPLLNLCSSFHSASEPVSISSAQVFRKFGVEKFDPTSEHFDPHRHHAVFQIPDASKPAGSVAAVLKSGYMLYDRVLRPAEVGVTESLNNESDQSAEA